MKKLGILGISAGLLVAAFGAQGAPSASGKEEDSYPGAWSEDVSTELMIALAQNHISGCGQFEQKKHVDRDEYLVACTPDGEVWTGYVVSPETKKVTGPVRLEKPPLGMSQR